MRMICQRCQKSLRSKEGLKCSVCQSKFHLKCINDEASKESCKDVVGECGDRNVQWVCSLCHANQYSKPSNSITKKLPENINIKENLMSAISILSEKIERISKIQLPKISEELSHVKTVTNKIAQQNSDILKKMTELGNRKGSEKSQATYRKRNLNFRSLTSAEKKEYMPLSSAAEKSARYHTRRKSFILNRMLHLLNRKNRFQRKRQ